MSETLINGAAQRQITHLLGIELSQTKRAVILAIGGIKGGIGKSTSSLFLAHVWASLGLRVMVIDADPKSGTSRKWARRTRERGENLLFTVKSHPSEDLEETIVENGWDQEFDLIILDTGGDNDRILRAAYRIADFMLFTASPSPADIDTLPDTARTTVGEVGQRDIPVAFLITSVKSDVMAMEAKAELRALNLPVLTQTVKHRLIYQQQYGWGITDARDYIAVRHELDTV